MNRTFSFNDNFAIGDELFSTTRSYRIYYYGKLLKIVLDLTFLNPFRPFRQGTTAAVLGF